MIRAFRKSFLTSFIVMLLGVVVLAGCGSGMSNGANGSSNAQAPGTGAADKTGAAANETKPAANAAQNQAANASQARVIKHEMGETTITGTPQRVVALEFSFVDALAAMDIKPVGVADDKIPDRIIPQLASKIGKYTSVGTRAAPSMEVIASLKPDLIIADLQRHKEIYQQLQQIAPTIVLKSLEASYQENIQSFQVIADAMGKKDVADKRLSQHQATLNGLKKRVPTDEKRTVMPAVVLKDGLNAHGSSSFTGEILQNLGLKNAIQQKDAYATLNLEQLVAIDPDILILMITDGNKLVIDQWQSNPLWKSLKAVKNNQVQFVDQNLWSRFRGLIAAETIGQQAIDAIYGQQAK